MTITSRPSHGLKSPIHGGRVPTAVGGGPTYRQPHNLTPTTWAKTPHSHADFALPTLLRVKRKRKS